MISPLAYKLSKETSSKIINSLSTDSPQIKFNLTNHKPKKSALRKITRQYLLDPTLAPISWRKKTGL